MVKIGITGGIGSGKSIVSTLFELHGIPVYNADEETKILNNTSLSIKKKLIEHFGEDLYSGADGLLNKALFASIIFSDSEKLKLANSIIHPEVLRHFRDWCTERAGHQIVALEAAILFESNFHKHLDKVVTIYSPRNLRLERVSVRDNTTKEMIEKRMEHQMAEKEKIRLAEYVIINDNKSSLIEQVQNLIEDITYSAFIAQ